MPGAAFAIACTQPEDEPWSPRQHGGRLVQYPPDATGRDKKFPPGNYICNDGKVELLAQQTLLHVTPPCMDSLGWIEAADLPPGATYTMAQSVVAVAGSYVFDRSFIDYIIALCPLRPMLPRYPNRYFLDKWMYQYRSTPQQWRAYSMPAKAPGGAPVQFGFYAMDFFGVNNPAFDPKGPNGKPESIQVEHSLEWGGSFDGYSLLFLLLYKQLYGDADGFCSARAALLRNGFAHVDWQVEASGTVLDGAWWQCWNETLGVQTRPHHFGP